MASTTERRERNREAVHEPSQERKQKAGELVDQADRLVGEVLTPGRWPQAKTVDRFLEEGRLERLLSLYGQAMWLDPSEPAYPWNLSSALRRLGQNDLAVGFLTRAINIGERLGEDDFSGPDAYLALAEMAIDADEPNVGLVAVAHAYDLGRGREDVDAYAKRLLADINSAIGGREAGRSLIALLERLQVEAASDAVT